jgi:hypothetical protein
MIPGSEIKLFRTTVTSAVDLARIGDAAEGYAMLLAGQHRAARALAEGAAWAEELAVRYRAAIEQFADTYQIGRG